MRGGIALLLSLLWWAAGVSDGWAQSGPFQFIRNRSNPTYFLNNDNGQPVAGPIQTDWERAHWSLESVPGEFYLRIVNREQGTYLANNSGVLELGPLPDSGDSANWIIEPVEGQLFVRIRNVSSGLYLLMQTPTGPLDLGALTDAPPDAAQPGAPQAVPPTAEWEFLAVVEQPGAAPAAAAARPTAPEAIIPDAQEWLPHVRACTGGKIFVRGACRCPIETAERDGICVPPQFDCEGGRIVRLQCICPDGRLPSVAGPWSFTCQRARAQRPNCRAGQQPAADGCRCRPPRQVINGVCRLPACRIGQNPRADRCLCEAPHIIDARGICSAGIRACQAGERPINDGCLCRAPLQMDNTGVCRRPGQRANCRIGQRPAVDQCECRAPNILQNDGVCRARRRATADQRRLSLRQADEDGRCRRMPHGATGSTSGSAAQLQRRTAAAGRRLHVPAADARRPQWRLQRGVTGSTGPACAPTAQLRRRTTSRRRPLQLRRADAGSSRRRLPRRA